MSEFDDDESEVDEAPDEVAERCAVGLLAFDAAAGLAFPDELQDTDGLVSCEPEVAPVSQVPGGSEMPAVSQELPMWPDGAQDPVGAWDETPPAWSSETSGEATAASAVDEALDSMTYDELVEAREQLVVSKEVAEYECLIDGVNPNFDPDVDNAYARNCGGCAFATWERLSGIDPQAQADWRNIGTIGGMEQACNMHFEECAPEQIEQFARSRGPGWRGMCAMQWPPDGETGHWVNLATSETGHVYVLDSQCSEVSLLRDYVEQNPAIRYHVNVK